MGCAIDLESRRNDNFNYKQFSSYASSIGSSAPPNPYLPSRHQIHAPPLGQTSYSTGMAASYVKDQPIAPLGLHAHSNLTSTHRVRKAAPASRRRARPTPQRRLHWAAEIPDLITREAHQNLEQVPSQQSRDRQVPLDLCQSVTIQLTNQTQRVQISDLLYYFWTKSANTKCMTCEDDFKELDPPIRTISLEQTHSFKEASELAFTPLTIRIHNRHLACIKTAKTAFIPVSHVWHQTIADAHIFKASSAAAVECLYNVIAQMLPIVTTKFKYLYDHVELWHDYVSIPQWEHEVQQSLLLMLPDIFGIAPLCLVHLDDVSARTIVAAAQLDDTTTRGDQYATLAVFFRARWFERMWVSLEYAHCNQACVYTMDGVIMCDNQEQICDSFSNLLEGFQQQMRKIVADAGGENFRDWFAQLPIPILGPLEDMRRNVKHNRLKLTFGEALSFIAGRNCRDYRDRFLAMCGFLNIGRYAEILSHIPKEPVQACLWLAHKCLGRGDYSPLLLLQKGESEAQCARWLAGHQSMSWCMWDLGAATTPPSRLNITLSDNHIYLELDRVGSLEFVYQPHFRNGNPFYAFDCVVSTILFHIGGVDVAAFLATLERIYAVPEFMRTSKIPVTLSEFLQVMPDFSQNLESLLNLYLMHPFDANTRLSICERVAGLLRFLDPFRGTLDQFSRLTYAAGSLGTSHCYDDVVGVVRCGHCAQAFLYRFLLLKGVGTGVQLYRIPGLGYMSSLPNGVGLLVSNGRVVGRIIYGSPACNCRAVERVIIL